MKRRVWLVLGLLAAAFVVGLAGYKLGQARAPAGVEQAEAAQQYHCPMHPEYVSDEPGSCPICGMDLVPIESHDEHEAAVD